MTTAAIPSPTLTRPVSGANDAHKTDARKKNVPALYETDASRYAGPHRWQTQAWARGVRRLWRRRAYTRWLEEACSSVEVTGLEHLDGIDGPCVFVGNHQSHIDTLVVHAALPEAVKSNLYYGAAQDRWFVKGRKKLVLKPWYQSLALGTFPILRGGGARALDYASELLAGGHHVFLFPEGTRSMNGELGEFKHGATLLAFEHDLPVVPIYLRGLEKIRPKNSREVIRGKAGADILAPIRFAPGSDVAAATDLIRERLSSVHRQHQPAEETVLTKAA